MNMITMSQVKLNVKAAREHAASHTGDGHLEAQPNVPCMYCVQIHIWLGEQADELVNSIMDLQRRIDAMLTDRNDVEELGVAIGVLTVMEASL